MIEKLIRKLERFFDRLFDRLCPPVLPQKPDLLQVWLEESVDKEVKNGFRFII